MNPSDRFGRSRGHTRHADEASADRTTTLDEAATTRPAVDERDETLRRKAEVKTDAGRRTDVRSVLARQHDEFGGFSWGSAFFGWLVATGIAALLLALVSATGTVIGLTEVSEAEAAQNSDTIGIAGGILLLVVVAVAYYAGGYVAGRMARFDGARQGLGVWVFGLIATAALAVAGVILGSEYNLLSQLNLPRIPVDEGDVATGGLIALAVTLVVTALAAVAGGKLGERFHRRIDRFGRDGDRVLEA